MRDCADRNKIHAGLGNRANRLQIHAAAGFGFGAMIHNLHRCAQLCDAHIIKQNDVRIRIRSLHNLLQRIGFNFNFSFGNFLRAH